MSVQVPAQPAATPTFAMLRALAGIATLSGLLVVGAFKLTLPRIEENQRQATERAIFEVVPGAVSRVDFLVTPAGLRQAPPGAKGELIYAAYDAEGQLKGLALPGAGQGYADLIRVLYAYTPACQCITGTKVLKMAETPGFGDKLTFDPAFLKNFEALDARLNEAGDGLAHAIITVRHGTKTEPWQVDAISGATLSSRGMGRALNDSAQRLLPLVHRQLKELETAGRSPAP